MVTLPDVSFYRTELRVLQSSMDNEQFLNVIAEKLAKLSEYEGTSIRKPKMITKSAVLRLVELTNGSFSNRECLIALKRANGDQEKALVILPTLGQV